MLTRSLRRIGERVRERTRSVAHRVLAIAQRSRTTGHRVPRSSDGSSRSRRPRLNSSPITRCVSAGRLSTPYGGPLWIGTSSSLAAPRISPSPMAGLLRNERAAHERGVRHVVLSRQPRETRPWRARMALRWRTGRSARSSAVMACGAAGTGGESGMQRWVGLGVIANNLLVLGRAGL